MSDRMFLATALIIIASILFFGCSGCASFWWRDSEIATERYPCCQWSNDRCVWRVHRDIGCPEKTP